MERLIGRIEVQERIGLSKSALYRRLSLGEFPRPLEVGGGSVRWKSSEIVDWIETRPRSKVREARD